MNSSFLGKYAPLLALLLLVLEFVSGAAFATYAQSANNKNSPSFTKIQDLNPNAKPLNRPVRQKWAVVVGISKFRDSRLNSDFALGKTAKDFYKYLVDPHGGRFRADHVRILTDEDATQQNINRSFGEDCLGELVGPDDLVLVYIATRAFPTTDGNSYLCAYNCQMDNIYGTCLSIESLMQSLKKTVRSDRILLILESAYSGAASLASESKSSMNKFNFDPDSIRTGRGLIILSSSRADQRSWQDIFSQNLIRALKEKDGLITLEEAFLKTQEQTEIDSIHSIYAGRKQTPVMKSDWKGNDLIIGCGAVEENKAVPDSMSSFLGGEAHYLNANRAVLGGELDKAISEYKNALADDPELTDARADYAVVLGMKGQWNDAEIELRKAIAIKPDDALYYTNYARVLDKLGKVEECKKALEKAYLLNPKDRVVLLALADKSVAGGDRETAMRLMDQALVLYPEVAQVQDRMCFLLSLEGRVDEAIKHAREAIRLDPDLAAAHLKLGALLLLKNDFDAAIGEYQSVLNKDDSNADAHLLLADALSKTSSKQRSLDEYSRFLELSASTDSRRAKVEQRLKDLQTQ